MELAKSDLDLLKEVAPQQIARDGNGADGGIEDETSKVRMRKFEPMNSRAQGERSGGT